MITPLTPLGDAEPLTPFHYAAIRRDGVAFLHCVQHASSEPQLVREVDRLFGTALAARKSPIEFMVDAATGRAERDIETFLRFVWNYVFLTLPELNPQTT